MRLHTYSDLSLGRRSPDRQKPYTSSQLALFNCTLLHLHSSHTLHVPITADLSCLPLQNLLGSAPITRFSNYYLHRAIELRHRNRSSNYANASDLVRLGRCRHVVLSHTAIAFQVEVFRILSVNWLPSLSGANVFTVHLVSLILQDGVL